MTVGETEVCILSLYEIEMKRMKMLETVKRLF